MCNQCVHFHLRAANIASNVSFLLSSLGISAIFVLVSVKFSIRLIWLCRITTTNCTTLSAYYRIHDALLHPHPLSHPHLQLHEIGFRSASGAGVRRLITGRNCPLTKSHPKSLGNGSFPSHEWTWWYTCQECSLAAADVGGRAPSWIGHVATVFMKQWGMCVFRDSIVLVAPYKANRISSPAKATAVWRGRRVEQHFLKCLKFWIMFD